MKGAKTSPRRFPSGFFVLITGGTRSGKSRLAVLLAKRFGRRIVYLATCEPADAEMRRRIARHRRARPASWRTIEFPQDLAHAIRQLNGRADGAVIDCLTMYVSGLVMHGDPDAVVQEKVRRLCRAIRRARCPIVMVTNEVGSSIVPEHELGRRFRDLAGLANQIAAEAADDVILMVAGMPVTLKSADSRGSQRGCSRMITGEGDGTHPAPRRPHRRT